MHHILHEVNYQTLIMMLSDAPRYVAGKSEGDSRFSGLSAEAEAAEVAGIFQTPGKTAVAVGRTPTITLGFAILHD